MQFLISKDFSEEEILYVCTSNTYVFIYLAWPLRPKYVNKSYFDDGYR